MSNILSKKIFILWLLLFAVFQSVNAQRFISSEPIKIKNYKMPLARDYNTWDFGCHLGMTNPYTDISGSGLGDLAFGLDASKFLSHSFALQARFIHGKLSGTDENKPEFQYHTTIKYDLSLNAVFQFGNISFLKRIPELAFYGYIGLGIIKYSPHVSVDNGNTELTGVYSQYSQSLVTKDYQNTSDLIIPFGFGCKYHLSNKYSVSAEYSFRSTNSDKLDGFYKLLSDNDKYSYFNLGFTYHFGDQNKTLEWDNPLQSVYNDLYDMKEKIDLITNDSDIDGVADLFDREPGTRSGNKVYGDGTSVDSDNDGVPDNVDVEPFSTKNAKVDASGKEIGKNANATSENLNTDNKNTAQNTFDASILQDSDHDGVADIFDREPNTPLGAKVYGDGSTVPPAEKINKEIPDLKDSDHDGVADIFDREPNTAPGAKVYGDGTTVIINEKTSKENPDFKDSDNDGVPDIFDREPNTMRGVKVYGDGTTVLGLEKNKNEASNLKDSDHDGVADIFDREPNTPSGAKVYGDGTTVPNVEKTNKEGLDLKDSDHDGVADIFDREPNTSPGAKVYGDGTTVNTNEKTSKENPDFKDSDNDGVPDIFDREPNTMRGAKVYGDGTTVLGLDKSKNQAQELKDSDNDGVADIFDREPNTPPGTKVYGDGTSVDANGDGVPDIYSKKESELQARVDALKDNIKKEIVSTVGNVSGMPLNQSDNNFKITKITIDSIPSVFFAFNDDRINLKYYKSLADIAMIMMDNPGVKFRIIGKSDGSTNSKYNIQLSKRRAEAVKRHFMDNYKINPDRFIVEPLRKSGELLSKGPNNRRVDIKKAD